MACTILYAHLWGAPVFVTRVTARDISMERTDLKLLNLRGHYMYGQFNIQQFYILPTQCIYVYVSENKQRLFPFTALTYRFL
jgi:hypothetical protein